MDRVVKRGNKEKAVHSHLNEALRQSLINDDSDVARRAWARRIVEEKIPLRPLLPLLYSEKKLAMRFSWILGGLVEQSPETIYPLLPYIFRKRSETSIPNFDRSVAKFLYYAGVPPAIEAEAMEQLFSWLRAGTTGVSGKMFCALALAKLAGKYPDIRNELRLCLSEQLGKNTASFDKRVRKLLAEMEEN